MNKLILAVLMGALFLTGCATIFHDSYGNPASSRDEFQCNRQCGWYDSKANVFDTSLCKVDCMHARGYQ